MQDDVVVDELDIARLELDIEIVRRIVRECVEQIERLDLLRGQSRRVGEALRRLDVMSVASAISSPVSRCVNAPASLRSSPRHAAGPSMVRIGIGGASVDSALARLLVMV